MKNSRSFPPAFPTSRKKDAEVDLLSYPVPESDSWNDAV